MEIKEVDEVRKKLKAEKDFIENRIDLSLPLIPPFLGKAKIGLIILGQDPTVRNLESRKIIKYTLNLEKNNSLKGYINLICKRLELTIENVYATNLFKYFYTKPPADTPFVLRSHLDLNLEFLIKEIAAFTDIPLITLGEPVLQLLTTEKARVREFWDYNSKTGKSNYNFTFSKAIDNRLNRDIYPLPHQPSFRKNFYKNTFNDYLKFIRSQNFFFTNSRNKIKQEFIK